MAAETNEKLNSTSLSLLDLPKDMINEVLLRLDLKSIENIGKTCTTLSQHVTQFMKTHKDYIARLAEQKVRIVVAGDEDSDDDYDDWDDYADPDSGSDIDDIQRLMEDVYDRASWGSNYDEEVEEFLNQS